MLSSWLVVVRKWRARGKLVMENLCLSQVCWGVTWKLVLGASLLVNSSSTLGQILYDGVWIQNPVSHTSSSSTFIKEFQYITQSHNLISMTFIWFSSTMFFLRSASRSGIRLEHIQTMSRQLASWPVSTSLPIKCYFFSQSFSDIKAKLQGLERELPTP